MNNTFENHILRDIVLSEILGDDKKDILYWAGKKLFHKFENVALDPGELIRFFETANFGKLNITNRSEKKYQFTLESSRAAENDAEFSLEAGFLCEAIQSIENRYATAEWEIKHQLVHINIDLESTTITK